MEKVYIYCFQDQIYGESVYLGIRKFHILEKYYLVLKFRDRVNVSLNQLNP